MSMASVPSSSASVEIGIRVSSESRALQNLDFDVSGTSAPGKSSW